MQLTTDSGADPFSKFVHMPDGRYCAILPDNTFLVAKQPYSGTADHPQKDYWYMFYMGPCPPDVDECGNTLLMHTDAMRVWATKTEEELWGTASEQFNGAPPEEYLDVN